MKVILLIFISCLTLISALSSINNHDEPLQINQERLLSRQKRKLLFPQFTTLQLSMCVISKVSHIESHRVAVNHGFQINYNLPFQLSSYYSPIFWARSLSNSSNLLIDFIERLATSDDFSNDNNESNNDADDEEDTTVVIEKEEASERKKRMIQVESNVTAGQFYSGLIEILAL
jgi:hypothetical protein